MRDRQPRISLRSCGLRALINHIKRNPFKGLGKPEPLKHALQGWWSRRISGEHRLVYRVSGKSSDRQLDIVQCRYHYWRAITT
jgi:toxin YoeB